MTFTRDEMEATLALQGWRPCIWGSIAAAYSGNLVVYLFENADGTLRCGHSTIAGWSGKRSFEESRVLDEWLMGDDSFWVLADLITAAETRGAGL